jgi:hypothetical protein
MVSAAGWASEPIRSFWRTKKSLASAETRIPDRPVHGPVTNADCSIPAPVLKNVGPDIRKNLARNRVIYATAAVPTPSAGDTEGSVATGDADAPH